MKYIIGIDGGGTKTEAAAYSLEGSELSSSITSFGNILVNRQEAIKNITDAIDECILALPHNVEEWKCAGIYLGLAGSEAGDASTYISKIIAEKYNTKVKVVNDSVIALAALLEGEDGIMTISGTGSISYGVYRGKTKSAGGWGNLLGDEGSGYYIAIEVLKHITLEEDLEFRASDLTLALLDKMGVKDRKDIVSFVYSSTKGEIAALVPTIVEQAEKGEETAVEILKRGGKDLADTTLRVYRNLDFSGPVSVGVKGSILTKVAIVRSEFEKYLKEYIEGVQIVDSDVSPTLGAYYLALKELGEKA